MFSQFYGPRIGALYHRGSLAGPAPLFLGGGQERGLRSGTENVPMAVGLGEAARLVRERLGEDMEHFRKIRDMLVQKLKVIIYKGCVIRCLKECCL